MSSRSRRTLRAAAALVFSLLWLAACGGGGGGGESEPVPETRQLPLDRLSVGAPLNGTAKVTVLMETDDDAGPYTAAVTGNACAGVAVNGVSVVVSGLQIGKCALTIRAASSTATIPVEVFDPFVLSMDELELAYTSDFLWVGELLGRSFRQPTPRDSTFLAFGTVINYDNGGQDLTKRAVLVVRAKAGSNAVLPTTQYEGAAPWFKPACAVGYRGLGVVYSMQTPSFPTACIRNDLTTQGNKTRSLIDVFGFGLHVAYAVDPPENPDAHTEHFFAPETFLLASNGSIPIEDAFVLKARLPVVADVPASTWTPKLTDALCGFAQSRPILTKAVRIPFTAVANTQGQSDKQRASESPFYVLERLITWNTLVCRYNDSSLPLQAKFVAEHGITTSESQTFSKETSIEISFEAGIEIDGIGAKSGTKLSTTFGYTRTSEVSELFSRTLDISYDAAPLVTTGLFQQATSFSLYRYSGGEMTFVKSTPAIGSDVYVVTQYPPAQ